MSTDANLVGKGDFSQNIEGTASTAPQMVNSGPQMVSDSEQAVDSLPPAATSAEQVPPATTLQAENFTVDIADPEEPKPVSIPVTKFLANHFHSVEKTALLRQAIQKVFGVFYSSEAYRGIENIDITMAYHALELSLDKMVVRGAERTSGPLPDKPVIVPGDIEEDPYQPQAYEVFMHNPANSTDVEHLQKWVVALQDVTNNLIASTSVLQQQDSLRVDIIERQEKLISNLERIDKIQQGQIATLQTKVPTEKAPKASRKLTFGFNVHLSSHSTSQAEILYFALTEYRDSRNEQYLKELRDGEPENAFVSFGDYEKAQFMLDKLQLAAIDLAKQNYEAAEYNGNTGLYLSDKTNRQKRQAESYKEFYHNYVGLDDPEEETSTDAPVAEPTPEA